MEGKKYFFGLRRVRVNLGHLIDPDLIYNTLEVEKIIDQRERMLKRRHLKKHISPLANESSISQSTLENSLMTSPNHASINKSIISPKSSLPPLSSNVKSPISQSFHLDVSIFAKKKPTKYDSKASTIDSRTEPNQSTLIMTGHTSSDNLNSKSPPVGMPSVIEDSLVDKILSSDSSTTKLTAKKVKLNLPTIRNDISFDKGLPVSKSASTLHTLNSIHTKKPVYKNYFLEKLRRKNNAPIEYLSPLQSPRLTETVRKGLNIPPYNDASQARYFYNLAKKILNIHNTFDDVFTQDDIIGNKKFTEAEIQQRNDFKRQIMQEIVELLTEAQENRSDKLKLDKILSEVVKKSHTIGSVEIYLLAFKLHGKIMMVCKELYRAVFIFKSFNSLSESNRCFTKKLKAYKYLAKCFQETKNYVMAKFYYVKMLQVAWICDSKRYELLAYDRIGLQYYYMGELDKAWYYHQKMMNDGTEGENSDTKKIGVSKMMNKLMETKHFKKRQRLRTIEEELATNELPESEDEFELPLPEELTKRQMPESNSKRWEEQAKLKKINAKRSTTTMKPSYTSFDNRRIEADDGVKRERFENLHNPPKDFVYMTHLSPVRALDNPHYGTKKSKESYMNMGEFMEESLDSRRLEAVKNKIEKFKNIIINTIAAYDKQKEKEEKAKQRQSEGRESEGIEKTQMLHQKITKKRLFF